MKRFSDKGENEVPTRSQSHFLEVSPAMASTPTTLGSVQSFPESVPILSFSRPSRMRVRLGVCILFSTVASVTSVRASGNVFRSSPPATMEKRHGQVNKWTTKQIGPEARALLTDRYECSTFSNIYSEQNSGMLSLLQILLTPC